MRASEQTEAKKSDERGSQTLSGDPVPATGDGRQSIQSCASTPSLSLLIARRTSAEVTAPSLLLKTAPTPNASSTASPCVSPTGERRVSFQSGPLRIDLTPASPEVHPAGNPTVQRTPPPSLETVVSSFPASESNPSIKAITKVKAGATHKRSHSHASILGDNRVIKAKEAEANLPLADKDVSRSACSSERSSLNNGVSDADLPIDANGNGTAPRTSSSPSGSSNSPAETQADIVHLPTSSTSADTVLLPRSDIEPLRRSDKTEGSGRKSGSGFKHALRSLVMNKSYVQRDNDFRKQFGEMLAPGDRYVVEYHCAYLNDRYLLLQGKMYITQRMIFFLSRVFRSTKLYMPFDSIAAIKKEKTIKLIENALRVTMSDGRSYFFASFASRNQTFDVLSRLLRVARGQQTFTNAEFWALAHRLHGSDLGFNNSASRSSSPNASPLLSPSHPGVSAHYPDYLEYLTSLQQPNSNHTSAIPSSVSGMPAPIDEVQDGETEDVVLVASDRSSLSEEEAEAEDDSVSHASYSSLADADSQTCNGHAPLEMLGVFGTYTLPIEKLYDNMMNLDSHMSKLIFEGQKSKLTNVDEWQRLEPTDADRERLPTRPEFTGAVELIKLHRRVAYTTSFTLMFTATVSNEEQQTVLIKRSVSDPNRIYSAFVSSRLDSSGMPLAKNAYFLRQICMHRVADDPLRSRLIVSQQIIFKSNFQKQALLTQMVARTDRYYKQLAELLVKEAEETLRSAPPERPLVARSSTPLAAEHAKTTVDSHVRLRSARKLPDAATANNVNTQVTITRQEPQTDAVPQLDVMKSGVAATVSFTTASAAPSASTDGTLVDRSSRSVAQFQLAFLLILLLAYIFWSQYMLNSHLEEIEHLLRDLLLVLSDSDKQLTHTSASSPKDFSLRSDNSS